MSNQAAGGGGGTAMEADSGPRLAWLAGALILVSTIAYLPSFNARFFLDDFRIILENPALQNALDPVAIWRFSEARFVASWTLAANYTLHGESVFGYHLVNFGIHLGSGAALYALLRSLLGSPALAGRLPEWARWVPLIAAAIYLLHPLQTQAVTYIVQRYTSLMAMFYLGSLAAFAWGRLRHSVPLYLAAALLAGLAMLTKQTAATLPLAALLIELLFFRRLSASGRTVTIAATLLGAGLIAWLVSLPALDIVGLTRETTRIDRLDYLATQMEVLWHYIGLFVLIGEQRLEYDIPVAAGFSQISTILMAMGHAVVIAAGLALWRRAPLCAFGILFYYLAHTVESSIFPIVDEAFEHRTYLPNAGLATLAGTGLAWLTHRPRAWRAGAVITLAVLLPLAGTTYARNALWADRIGFLEAETRLSPADQRAWTSLGKELMREGRFQAALETLQEARRIAIEHDGELRPPTLLNLIFALHYNGRNAESVELAGQVPIERFNDSERGFLFEARGRAHLELGNPQRARADLERSARLNPTPNAVAFLAEAEWKLGNRQRARRLARQVLASAPDHPLAREIASRAGD
ncbi:MAG: tetratricopeptide repeat protein [Candidatus Wenzhouxiangella sp. M2_3B_020]